MANEVTGASLSQIYGRLNSAPRHHPVGAKTFTDWSVEAGDMITITRDGRQYQSPVHTSSMNWKGGAAELDVGSTGNEKRDPVAKMQKRKYNSGSSGVRNSEKLYAYEVNQDHLLYEVYDSQGRFSKLEVTVRGLFHEVYDTNGRFSVLQNTVNGLRHEVYDTDGRFSVLQNTVNGLRHEVYDTNGRFSLLQNTVDGLHHEVYDTNGSFSTLSNTVDGLHHEVYDPNTGLKTQVSTQAGAFSVLCSGTGSNSKLKPAAIQAGIDAATGESKILLSANHIVLDGNVVANAIRTADITVGGLDVTNGIDCKAIDATTIDCTYLNTNGGDVVGGTGDFESLIVNDCTFGIYDITVSGNTMTIYKLDGTTIPFNKAVSLSGTWSGTTYNVSATAGVISGTAPSTSVYLQVDGTANPSKDVYAKIFHDNPSVSTNQLTSKQLELVENTSDKKVYLNVVEGSARLTKGAVSTQNTYNNGWTGSYGQIGLNYTSYGDTYTLNPNGSMTVYPTAKATPSAGTASITTKGITIKARALNLQTPISAFTPTTSGVTYTPDAGYDGFAQVTVEGDSSLKPENIKKNVEIFNIRGTYEGTTYDDRTLRCVDIQDSSPGSPSKYYFFRLFGQYNFSMNTNYTFYRTSWPT